MSQSSHDVVIPRERDPWYHGTADGMHPEEGGTVVLSHQPGSVGARELAASIAHEMEE